MRTTAFSWRLPRSGSRIPLPLAERVGVEVFRLAPARATGANASRTSRTTSLLAVTDAAGFHAGDKVDDQAIDLLGPFRLQLVAGAVQHHQVGPSDAGVELFRPVY